MMDSYVGGIRTASFVPHDEPTIMDQPTMLSSKQTAAKPSFQPAEALTNTTEPIADYSIRSTGYPFQDDCVVNTNQTDEAKIINLTCTDEISDTHISKTDHCNSGYEGLSILPWEEFVFNPRVLNDLFYAETNQKITYDPDEVNVFFHGKNVMPPSIGDISENGKAWNVNVTYISELREIRQWLTDRCSVFGVTLEYKAGRFAKPERAPCLVMLDPNVGTLGDQMYTALTKAMDSLHNKRRFCVEVNLNRCVERWCRRVLLTECRAVGAKLVITNGEEYTEMGGVEAAVCCIVCCPVWTLQTAVYKLHRMVAYDDFRLTFDAEEMFLHGAYEDPRCQRQQIFGSDKNSSVFRTHHLSQTGKGVLQSLGTYQFVSVLKDDNVNNDGENVRYAEFEYDTTSFGSLVNKRKEKVLNKERKQLVKTKTVTNDSEASEIKVTFKVEDNSKPYILETENTNEAFTESDEENYDIPTLTELPDSRFQDNPTLAGLPDSTTSREVQNTIDCQTIEDRLAPLFSPRLDTMCPQTPMEGNSEKHVNTDTETDIHTFREETSYESEVTESEPEAEKDYKIHTGKEDMLMAMMKIEMTLKSNEASETFQAKDITNLTNKEMERKQLPVTGKKRKKSKANVKSALKDLMKTTKYSKEATPSATDTRYLTATNEIKNQKKKSKNNSKITRKECENGKSQAKNNSSANIKLNTCTSNKCENVVNSLTKIDDNKDTNEFPNCQIPDQGMSVATIINTDRSTNIIQKETNDLQLKKNAEQAEEKPINTNRPRKFKEISTVNSLQSDSSSSDGDDVEIIYQSPQTEQSSIPSHVQILGSEDSTEVIGTQCQKHVRNEVMISDDIHAKQMKCELFDFDKEHSRPESRTFLEDSTVTNIDSMFQQNAKSWCDTSLVEQHGILPKKQIQTRKSKRSRSIDTTVLGNSVFKTEAIVNSSDQQKTGSQRISQTVPSIVPRLNLKSSCKSKIKRGAKKNSSMRKYLGTSTIAHKQK